MNSWETDEYDDEDDNEETNKQTKKEENSEERNYTISQKEQKKGNHMNSWEKAE